MVVAVCCDKRTTVELSDTAPDGGVFRTSADVPKVPEEGGITPRGTGTVRDRCA